MFTTTNQRLRRTRGFTILELMFTITVAAIILGIAVPSFRSAIGNNRLITQTNDLVGAINFARSDAITRNGSVTFCRATSSAATTCAASLGDWTDWILRNSGGVVRRGTVDNYGGTLTVDSDLTLDAVTFGADGLARTGGVLVNNRRLMICTSTISVDNIRSVALGAGSRLSTTKGTGTC